VIDFLKSKYFLKHLLLSIAVLVILMWIIFKLIGNYTLHGETVTVPDLKGMTIEQVNEAIETQDLRYQIVDSIYDAKQKKGAVVDQSPSANMQVKENRTIYLTLNAHLPPQVKMPNLIDVSLRQATAMLQTYGLEVGKLRYEPDFAKNAVLKQFSNGKVVKAGEMLRKGSKIDLVLGDGLSNEKVSVPYVIGMLTAEAIRTISEASLNVGSIVPDDSVKDSTKAKVYRQAPEFSSDATVGKGSSIDIFITESPDKIATDKDSLK